jgi:ABC-type multidrug transport system fused ATPase/permease subunit
MFHLKMKKKFKPIFYSINIFKDPVLFSGTLRINIDPFEAYTDEQLWNALGNKIKSLYIFI